MKKRYIAIVLIICLSFCLLSCKKSEIPDVEVPLVSLWQVVMHPERFHGKRIQTIGFASVGFERFEIFASNNWAHIGCISVPFSGKRENDEYWQKLGFKNAKEASELDQNYVLIEGVFDKNETTMFCSTGGFSEVVKYELWSGEK